MLRKTTARPAPTTSVRPRSGVPALGHVARHDHQDDDRDRDVDEEHPTPGSCGDEVPADERTGGGRQAAESRPGTDGPSAIRRAERRLEDGEAGGREQCTADTLEDPGHDQEAGVRGDPAAHRRHGEPDDADGENPPPPQPVAERTAEEQERSQRERVAGDDPLQGAESAVKGAADGGQGDADDGGIEAAMPEPSTDAAITHRPGWCRTRARRRRRRPPSPPTRSRTQDAPRSPPGRVWHGGVTPGG